MKWHEFVELAWHWITTSRYTRRVEAENRWLLEDNKRLRADNDCLMRSLHPQLKGARLEQEAHKEAERLEFTTHRW